jgi:lysozyme family protein
MANFDRALQRILTNEGGYVNHADDPGGETYCGVSRRYHPDWEGWVRIDEYKAASEFPYILHSDRPLKNMVRDFYTQTYWAPVGGDTILYQPLAEELVDIAVHMGVKRAVKYLQRGLNVLNRQATLWPDLNVDGYKGKLTTGALGKCEAMDEHYILVKLLVLQRGARYIARALEHEPSEQFIRGWLKRVKI